MNDAKENPAEFAAYLSYVRGLWGVSNKVSRQIVRFYLFNIMFLMSATTIFIRLSVARASLILSLAWMMVV